MILHCVHVIHSLEPGGAERVLVDLAQVAPTVGLRLTVVSLMRVQDRRIADALLLAGAAVHDLGLTSRWDVRAVSRCLRLASQLKPDLLHAHLKHADLVCAVVATALSIPLISTLHVIEDAPRGLALLKRQVAAAARNKVAARTIAVSEAQRQWYVNSYAVDSARVVTVRNGVASTPLMSPADRSRRRSQLGVPREAVLAVMVSIMRPGKGHADLLHALRMVPEHVNLRVVFAGDGPLRGELEAAARASGLAPGRAAFVGFVEDVSGLLGACDLVVQPSAADALPTSLIQALAAGVPAVATAVGGIPEIVTSDVGLLVSPGCPSALSGALVTMASDPSQRRRCSGAARQRFVQMFSAEAWAQRLTQLYGEVLAECRA